MLEYMPVVLSPKKIVDLQCPIGVGIYAGFVRQIVPGTENMTVTICAGKAPLCVTLEMEIVRNYGSVGAEDSPAWILVWHFPNEWGDTIYFIVTVVTVAECPDDEAEIANKEDV